MERIQRKRTKGWKMPENTKYVGRPTKWGNPFTYEKSGNRFEIKTDGSFYADKTRVSYCKYYANNETKAKEAIIFLYRNFIKEKIMRENLFNELEKLRQKNLACFCSLSEPCHVDVLLELLAQHWL